MLFARLIFELLNSLSTILFFIFKDTLHVLIPFSKNSQDRRVFGMKIKIG